LDPSGGSSTSASGLQSSTAETILEQSQAFGKANELIDKLYERYSTRSGEVEEVFSE